MHILTSLSCHSYRTRRWLPSSSAVAFFQVLHLRGADSIDTDTAAQRALLAIHAPNLSAFATELTNTFFPLERRSMLVVGAQRLHGCTPLDTGVVSFWESSHADGGGDSSSASVARKQPSQPSQPSPESDVLALSPLTVPGRSGGSGSTSAVAGWPTWAAEMRRRAFKSSASRRGDAAAADSDDGPSRKDKKKKKRRGGKVAVSRGQGSEDGGSEEGGESGWDASDARALALVVATDSSHPIGASDVIAAADPAGRDASLAGAADPTDCEQWPLAAPFVDVHAAACDADGRTANLLKRAYRTIEQYSFLDWGLTSDYDEDIAAGGAALSEQRRLSAGKGKGGAAAAAAAAPGRRRGASSATHATWNGIRVTQTVHDAAGTKEAKSERGPSGLGGNTRGSEGYGELTHGSMSRLIVLLRHLRHTVLSRLSPPGHGALCWPAEFDLNEHSTFVDVGSGYGKAVIHVALLGRVHKSIGIECVMSRHQIAEQSLQELQVELLLNPSLANEDARPLPDSSGGGKARGGKRRGGNGDTATGGSGDGGANGGANGDTGASAPYEPYKAVCFHFGDATVGRSLDVSHVYCFDRVFSPVTMRALARLLMRSPFRIFASFRTKAEWWHCGLTCVHPIARLRVATTGGQSMSVHIYANFRYAPQLPLSVLPPPPPPPAATTRKAARPETPPVPGE